MDWGKLTSASSTFLLLSDFVCRVFFYLASFRKACCLSLFFPLHIFFAVKIRLSFTCVRLNPLVIYLSYIVSIPIEQECNHHFVLFVLFSLHLLMLINELNVLSAMRLEATHSFDIIITYENRLLLPSSKHIPTGNYFSSQGKDPNTVLQSSDWPKELFFKFSISASSAFPL